MIHVSRNTVPPPGALRSEYAQRQMDEADKFFFQTRRQRRQERFDLEFGPTRDPVARTLARLFHSKCAYCERRLPDKSLVNPGHFRPPKGALGDDGWYLDHYWWLFFKWTNLLPICAECAKMRGTRFPVLGPRAEICAGETSLGEELPLLLNPCEDDPAQHLRFDTQGKLAGISERGRQTITVFGLNRSPLLKARRAIAGETLAQLSDLSRITDWPRRSARRAQWEVLRLESLLDSGNPHAGLTRQFAYDWLHAQGLREFPASRRLNALFSQYDPPAREQQATALRETAATRIVEEYSVEATSQAAQRAYYSGRRSIERIVIHNFKGIAHLELSAPEATGDNESWLMFLGENATGKSTALQAIALTLMGQAHCDQLVNVWRREGIKAGNFHRKEATDSGYVHIFLTNMLEPVKLEFNRDGRFFKITPKEPSLLLLGYGATRLLPRARHLSVAGRGYIRVRNLFDPFARLNHAERWLTDRKAVSDEQFHRIAVALKKLFDLETEGEIKRDASKVWVPLTSRLDSLAELSDGYQSVVAMAVDIIIGVAERWPEIEHAEGVVLVDELEVHLHPVWKMRIVTLLRQVFPRMMFIATTHDPLCLRGLNPGEIVVFKRTDAGNIGTVITESIAHLRADQLLTSPLFGLVGTREPSFTDKLREIGREYDELFAKTTRTPEEEEQMLALRKQINEQTPSGESPESQLVESAVRQAVVNLVEQQSASAKVPTMTPLNAPEQIKAAIRGKVAELLESPVA